MKPRAFWYVRSFVRPATVVRLASAALLTLLTQTLATAPAQAQPRREPAPEDILPQSQFEGDPIGVDENVRGVEAAANRADAEAAERARALDADAAKYGPTPPVVTPVVGEALTSVRSARERTHRVEVRLDAGLAFVHVEMAFVTPVDKPAEVRYRLAVPARAQLVALAVCNDRGCRDGVPDRSDGALGVYDDAVQARGPERVPPVAHAVTADDARGRAIVVRAAPVVAGRDLTLRVDYVADAPVRAGLARLALPARGMDPNAAPAEVRFTASDMTDARIAGAPATDAPARFDPWVDVPLTARLPDGAAPRRTAWTYPCASGGRCARAYVVAGPRDPQPRDLVIAIDVSPSTMGPARGRLLPAIASMLAAAPEGTRVRAVVFAARARAVVTEAEDAATLPLARFSDAIDATDLGSATRLEAVWDLVHDWFRRKGPHRLRPAIVIVGDGGLTSGDARPFERARRAGVEVHVLNVSQRASVPVLRDGARSTGGAVIDIGRADDVSIASGTSQLDQRMGALFAPVAVSRVAVTGSGEPSLGALRAGDAIAWEGPVRGTPRLVLAGRALPARSIAPDLAAALGARVTDAPARDTAGASEPRRARALVAVDARDFNAAGRGARPESRKGRRCDPRGPAWRHGGVSGDAAPLALAEARACTAPPKPAAKSGDDLGTGMPADPLLGMLRLRVIPLARGCFRRDRAGRVDYAVRAVFVFALAEREVVSARVDGAIADRLRDCLLQAVDMLDVPRFTGLVEVRYPLHTEREALPREIELTPRTAIEVDRLLGPPQPAGEVHVLPPRKRITP